MNVEGYRVDGKTAIVTGAARGIGRAIALTLAKAGADIAAIDLATDELQRATDEVRGCGRRALAITADVGREDQVREAVKTVLSGFGRVDILCNNAGIVLAKPIAVVPEMRVPDWLSELRQGALASLSVEEWHRVMDTNLTSAFLFAREVGPHMMEKKRGKVVNISSTSAWKGTPYYAAYCVSKAGLSSFTRCLASEWAQFNINVNAIAPGTVDTEMTAPDLANPDRKQFLLDAIPLGRLAAPREIAALALFLASEASDYITGQTLTVDGGQLGRGPGI